MRLICFSLLFFVFKFASCASPQQNASNQQTPRLESDNGIARTKDVDSELERNRRLWQENKISDYRMTVAFSSGGLTMIAPAAIIEVRDGEAVSIKPSPANSGTTERYKFYDTIEKMFETIGKARSQKAEKIEVEYDAGRGYPKKIYIDLSSSAEDDGFNINVTKLEGIQ